MPPSARATSPASDAQGEITLTYCLCDDLLKAEGRHEHNLCHMTDAEVMTCALTASRFFGGRLEHARRYMLKPQIPS